MSSSDDISLQGARDIGTALRESRKRQRLTQLELADAAGVSRQHLGELEAGQTTERLEELFALFELLGLELLVRSRRPRRGSRP